MAKEVKRCVIISGAPETDIDYIAPLCDGAFVICADSGYLKAQKLGINIDLIIADFDSAGEPKLDCKIKKLPVQKEHTDTFECVITAVDMGFSDITVVGGIGTRVDHSYSNILCLDYCKKRDTQCTIVSKNTRISLISEARRIYREYQWFSLFAFMEECRGVSISGAHYTAGFYGLDKLDFKPSDQFGQSNFVEGEFATVTVDKGTLLLIESND
ncbi:MAG: thiamine diphosphokinase [Eubacterium sp.]|nr:thiamine diphosphokinase [Eubacterium sp.]